MTTIGNVLAEMKRRREAVKRKTYQIQRSQRDKEKKGGFHEVPDMLPKTWVFVPKGESREKVFERVKNHEF